MIARIAVRSRALFHDVAVLVEHVIPGRSFRHQIFDEAVQLGALRAVVVFD